LFMADLAMLFTFFGAAGFIVIKFFMGQMFKGWIGLVIKSVLGIVLAIIAAVVAPTCPALAVVLVAAAITMGGLFGVIILLIAQNIPFLGGMIAGVMEPFSGIIMVLIILAVVEFVVDILAIVLVMIPILNIISIIVAIAVPIIQLLLMWSIFGGAFSQLPDCLGLSESSRMAVPGSGGIFIGTGK